MGDFFEIDFLDVEAKSSGDAICMRYELNGQTYIHVVDGGFQQTGESVVKHINKWYGNPRFIDHVVCTHNDGDHAGGLLEVLKNFEVGTLWMLRPWMYAEELFERFPTISRVDLLRSRLRSAFPNLAALEDLATELGVDIEEPFQEAQIGAFHVLAPTRGRFLDLVVKSDKTPEGAEEQQGILSRAGLLLRETAKQASALVRAAWGDEYFPPGETSTENEMSVVQYAYLNDKKIILTGDTGRAGLREVIDYLNYRGFPLPGFNYFQVPHHGGRHNVNTELLDELLGPKLEQQQDGTWTAVICSAKADEDHPRKSVVRAMIHRGATVLTTEGQGKRVSRNAPDRGWPAATPVPYPDSQED